MGRTQSMNYLTQPCIADCAEVWQPGALWVSEAVLVIERQVGSTRSLKWQCSANCIFNEPLISQTRVSAFPGFMDMWLPVIHSFPIN